MQYNFGTGLLEFTPPGSNQTPVQCGVLKEVSLDIDRTMKELVGQYQVAVDSAVAQVKFAGKAKSAVIFGAMIQNILSGSTLSTGSTVGAINEVGTVPGSGPYAVTVAGSATFAEDLGVTDATTGIRMVRVASAPTTGQYSVSAGVYTFAAADTGHTIWISYSYTTTGGKTVAFSNQLMGQNTTFTLTLFNTYASKNVGVKLYAASIPKLGLAFKSDDYTEQNLDFVGYANGAGKVLDFYSTE